MKTEFYFVAILLMSVMTSTVCAQKAKYRKPGGTEVHLMDGTTVNGTLVSINDSSIQVKISKSEKVSGKETQFVSWQQIEAHQIKKITISIKNAEVFGALAGAVVGGIVGVAITPGEEVVEENPTPCFICIDLGGGPSITSPVLGGIVGAVLGGITGAIVGEQVGKKTFKINGEQVAFDRAKARLK